MALESISNTTAATYKESMGSVQKVSVQSTSIKDQAINFGLAVGGAEVSATAILSGKQDNTNDNGQQKSGGQAKAQRIKNAITQANYKMKQTRTGCEFSYNEEVNRVSIKVFDKETQEVIREIPPEESLEMLEKFWEIAGLIVDEKR